MVEGGEVKLSNQHPLVPDTDDTQTMKLNEQIVDTDERSCRTFEASIWIDGREFRIQHVECWGYKLIPVVGHS